MNDSLAPGTMLNGQIGSYKIIGPLDAGGSGQAFRARVESTNDSAIPLGASVVVKVPLLRADVPLEERRRRMSDIDKSIKREIWLSTRLSPLDCVAQILDWGTVKVSLGLESDSESSFAVQQLVEGKRLDRYLCDEGAPKNAGADDVFKGVSSAEQFFAVALKVASSLRAIHREQIVHGDVWFKNVIIDQTGKAVFIDFGLSAVRDLNLANQLSAPDEDPDRLPEGTGSVKNDIHAFGALLYYLATGSEKAPPHCPDVDDLKNNIRDTVHNANRDLYDDNSGVVDVIARCRRYYQHQRFHNVEGVIQELEAFSGNTDLEIALSPPAPILDELDRTNQPLFSRLARLRIRAERRILEDMMRHVYDLAGDHEDIVSGFMQYLSVLGRGDEYLTISTPDLWRAGTRGLGINGRVLTMNKLAAQRGATIRRVFALTPSNFRDREVQRILEAHIRISDELKDNSKFRVQTDRWELEEGGYYTGFRAVTEEEQRNLVNQRNHYGLVVNPNGQTIAAPVYTSTGELVEIEFRTADEFVRDKRQTFVDNWLPNSEPLTHRTLTLRSSEGR
jgi:serine/threonine protein kinase